ncbi:hypothetical protein T4C_972, partial [Trichinella pseudospiralis]
LTSIISSTTKPAHFINGVLCVFHFSNLRKKENGCKKRRKNNRKNFLYLNGFSTNTERFHFKEYKQMNNNRIQTMKVNV